MIDLMILYAVFCAGETQRCAKQDGHGASYTRIQIRGARVGDHVA
jgi:hypothetical protein